MSIPAVSKENNHSEPIIASGTLGIIILIITECMFYAGFISGYLVNRIDSSLPWPPPGQPRLPLEMSTLNSIVLILSGILLFIATRKIAQVKGDISRFTAMNESVSKIKRLVLISILLGILFLLIQGAEWVKMLGFGVTTRSSLFAAYFYLLIGLHGIHVTFGLVALITNYLSFNKYQNEKRYSLRLVYTGYYWYFVVLLWPILYYLLYIL